MVTPTLRTDTPKVQSDANATTGNSIHFRDTLFVRRRTRRLCFDGRWWRTQFSFCAFTFHAVSFFFVLRDGPQRVILSCSLCLARIAALSAPPILNFSLPGPAFCGIGSAHLGGAVTPPDWTISDMSVPTGVLKQVVRCVQFSFLLQVIQRTLQSSAELVHSFVVCGHRRHWWRHCYWHFRSAVRRKFDQCWYHVAWVVLS